MLIVKVKDGNIDKALKALKNKVIKTKQNITLYEKREFIKPSIKRRQEVLTASYKQSKVSEREKREN